jgi:hypothetical protein
MNKSPKSTSKTKPPIPSFPASFDANHCSVEELDEWIISLGGKQISRAQAAKVVQSIKWSDVPGENPGDPGFPFSSLLSVAQK